MKYRVYLIDSNGQGSYLSFKGKTAWKTKSIAIRHAKDIQTLIDKGKNIFDAVIVEVHNEYNDIELVLGILRKNA